MAEATKKGTKLLVESIDHMNVTSLVLEDKWTKVQDKILEKQLRYFQTRNEATNCTQMDMVWALNSLIQVMTLAFTRGAANNN